MHQFVSHHFPRSSCVPTPVIGDPAPPTTRDERQQREAILLASIAITASQLPLAAVCPGRRVRIRSEGFGSSSSASLPNPCSHQDHHLRQQQRQQQLNRHRRQQQSPGTASEANKDLGGYGGVRGDPAQSRGCNNEPFHRFVDRAAGRRPPCSGGAGPMYVAHIQMT